MRWSAGHIFAPPPPQLDCAHQAAAAGGWQPWPGPPGAGAVRSEAGTLQIQTLGTGDSRGIVLGKGQSPESCLCGLSAFVIRIHHSGDNALTRSGWRGLGLAWLAGVTIALERNQHWDREREDVPVRQLPNL